jgi:preprotein translocase subunit SecG
MDTVVIVIHLMVILALIAVILLQRSEGGALGIGGSNNFLSGRGSGNLLTRTTSILGIVFFATSMAMTILARMAAPPSSILEQIPAATAPAPAVPGATIDGVEGEIVLPPADGTGAGGILDELEAFTGGPPTTAPAEPQVPITE